MHLSSSLVPVKDADIKASSWHAKWTGVKVTTLQVALALRDWHGYIAPTVLRFKVTDKVSQALVSWLPENLQYRLFRNQSDEVNKPQFRTQLASTIYLERLHPAARLFKSHLHFLAALQAAYSYLHERKSYYAQCQIELTRIRRSESNKRRKSKRARAKDKQQSTSSTTSGSIPSNHPTASSQPLSSPSKSPSDKASPLPTNSSKTLDIEEHIRKYCGIEIFPPSP